MTRYTPRSIRGLQAHLQLLLGNYLALRSIDPNRSKRHLFHLYNVVNAIHGFLSFCILSSLLSCLGGIPVRHSVSCAFSTFFLGFIPLQLSVTTLC